MSPSIRGFVEAALLALVTGLCHPATADPAPWPPSSVIYSIYPSIFSPKGDFAGIMAQLGRLKDLGITDIWIMPVTPIGKAINGHPSFNSPYAVHDYYALNPDYGTPADLHQLISKAHALGLRIILDEVLNHTAWDNALITEHPEYYVHSDNNTKDPGSVKMAFNYRDVAQLDYGSRDLRDYMIRMLRYWITEYKVDGFRFDSADNPGGPNRKIPADFWQELAARLREIKPDVLLLAEEATPDLALKPFSLDYGWPMVGPMENASKGGDAFRVRQTWLRQQQSFPGGMLHMAISDDWDYPRDVNRYGGPAGALAVEAFYLTDTGVPLIYNGMEIGNSAEGVNPHTPIDWSKADPAFPEFYRQMLTLRRENPALQQGKLAFLVNSAPHSVITYERSAGGKRFVVEINFSDSAQAGMVTVAGGEAGWTEVTPSAVRGKVAHVLPPRFELGAKGIAVFEAR